MINIYTAVWCAYCHAVKDYLDKLGVTYSNLDIEKDPANATASVEKSGQMGIPVIDIDGDIIVGFDKPKIDTALKAHKYI